MLELTKMTTEQRNKDTMRLDEFNGIEIATIMNTEDLKSIAATHREIDNIGTVIDLVAKAFSQGGRLIYIGAGTSGRIGLLDAVECPPTFGVDSSQVVALIAGGSKAFIKAVEGAEDNQALGREDLIQCKCTKQDVVIGISASGRTPFVIGGLIYANELGCETVAISNNQNAPISSYAKTAIELDVGPEVLTGSTRLKSGTSQKMVCNMISTGSMILAGKVYQNLMVDVQQTNEKLEVRAQNIIMEATSVDRIEAQNLLREAKGSVKTAIVMKLLDCDYDVAMIKLKKEKGHIKGAIKTGGNNE